jgi:hypothetical protein
MSKIILTIDTEAIDSGEYFTIEKPDDMHAGTLLKHLMWVSSVLVMQANDEHEPDNIVQFPGVDLEDVLDTLAQIPMPDSMKDDMGYSNISTTSIYLRDETED